MASPACAPLGGSDSTSVSAPAMSPLLFSVKENAPCKARTHARLLGMCRMYHLLWRACVKRLQVRSRQHILVVLIDVHLPKIAAHRGTISAAACCRCCCVGARPRAAVARPSSACATCHPVEVATCSVGPLGALQRGRALPAPTPSCTVRATCRWTRTALCHRDRRRCHQVRRRWYPCTRSSPVQVSARRLALPCLLCAADM